MRLVSLFLIVAVAPTVAADGFQSELEQWRQQRVESLTREDGWIALVGLHWLDAQGPLTIGAGADRDIQVDDLPDLLGELRRGDVGWRLSLAGDNTVFDGERIVTGGIDLVSDRAAGARGVAATRLRHGPVRMQVIERGDRQALRVWSAQAPARQGFAGLSYFPADRDWQLRGRWQPHEPARKIEIVDVTGALQAMTNPGAVVFERDGREHRLEALAEPGDAKLFLIFADRSSGRESYGAGRYLYADRPDHVGTVQLDFNRAYNPPCAFSAYATCPLPPPENRLDLRVAAGELRYRLDDQP